MSVLDQVRAKYKAHSGGVGKTSESAPDCIQTSLSTACKTSRSPSAGSAGYRHTHFEPEACHQDVIGLSPVQTAARREVLAQLAANRSIRRAFVNRFDESGTMIITLAIRGIGTGELWIPVGRLDQRSLADYGALLQTMAMGNSN